MIRNFLLAVFSLVFAATWASAEPVPCPDPMFVVDAPDAELQGTLCQAAMAAADNLGQCGLEQVRPVTIQIVDAINHPVAECLAAFDCELDLIRVTSPDRYTELLAQDSAYAMLPADILLRALITHEVAHAFVEQSTEGRQIEAVDHEFIAAAMEFDLMPPLWRDVILDYAMLETPRAGLINIWIYRLEPRRFSANAWLYFQQPGNGCDLVRRIVGGEISFADPQN